MVSQEVEEDEEVRSVRLVSAPVGGCRWRGPYSATSAVDWGGSRRFGLCGPTLRADWGWVAAWSLAAERRRSEEEDRSGVSPVAHAGGAAGLCKRC